MNKKIIIYFLFIVCIFSSYSSLKAQQIDEFKDKGVIYISTFSFVNGFNEIAYSQNKSISNRITAISAHQVVGYQFNPYFSIGMGLGFEKWKHTSFIPLYADIRANIFAGRYSPFVSADFGYSSKWYESPLPEPNYIINGATEGLFFAGGIGLKVMFSNSAAGIISFEFKLQESSIKWSDENNLYNTLTTNQEDRAIYQFLGIRAGILF